MASTVEALKLPSSHFTNNLRMALARLYEYSVTRVSLQRPRLACVYFRAVTTGGADRAGSNLEWRKVQLNRLRQNFHGPIIESDDELQPMWKDMESRVLRRKSVPIENAKGRVGRSNVRPTDEESWLVAGLYDQNGTNEDDVPQG